MTDKSQKSRGISGFIVEKGTPGFSFGTKEKKMGIRGSATYELVFEDCKIPKELDGGRIGVAAQALGIAQSAIDHCVKYVTENTRDEKKISQYQFTQFELADMQARVDAARLLVYRAAQEKQEHEPYSHLAAMGKLYAAEAATNVTRRCMQLVGYEGTSEVQRMVISSWMGIK